VNKPSVKNYLREIAQDKCLWKMQKNLLQSNYSSKHYFLVAHKSCIDLERYKTKYGADLFVDKKTIIDALIKNKLVELKNGFLMPTTSGMAVADSLALI